MEYRPTLQAAPSLVILDIEAGQTKATTEIEYSKEAELTIWHRWKPGAWLPVGLQVTSPDDPALRHGYFTSPPLEPGTIYQVAIWETDIDPNQLPSTDKPLRALVAITVFALRKRPRKREFLSDENQRTGGTFRERQLATTAPVYAYMALSLDPPRENADGYQDFAHIEGQTWAPLNQSFLLQITDLLPGTHYNELVRLSDAFGNWQFLSKSFTTLQRRIRVQPTGIFIGDDSDDLSNGEGQFTFELETGDAADPASWTVRDQLAYSNGNLETGKSVAPAPTGELSVGPERVTKATRHARLRVSGQEDDSGSVPLDSDDCAKGMKDLLIPTGTIDEIVSHRSDSIAAQPYIDVADEEDGFLRFIASYKYWIDYF